MIIINDQRIYYDYLRNIDQIYFMNDFVFRVYTEIS